MAKGNPFAKMKMGKSDKDADDKPMKMAGKGAGKPKGGKGKMPGKMAPPFGKKR